MPNHEVIIADMTLEEALAYILFLRTPEGIVECINFLEVNEKKALTKLVRTSDEGIKAYTAFNYGA